MLRGGEFGAKSVLNVDMPAEAIYYAPDYQDCCAASTLVRMTQMCFGSHEGPQFFSRLMFCV